MLAQPGQMRKETNLNLTQQEIIQILRRRAGMNQGTFGAKAFNTSYESGRTKIKNIELGRQKPTRKDLKQMSMVLGVSSSELTEPSKKIAGAGPGTGDGILVTQKALDLFPGIGSYLEMLNKAVTLDDKELIDYISAKIAHIMQTRAHNIDAAAV
jgi:DNA-binding transcriptional regulator YiaG